MSFGWSAGDIAAAINLTITVTKALREIDGAASEYQLLVEDLNHFRQILEILRDLQPTPATRRQVNAIRGMANECQEHLQRFLKRIQDSYKDSLAPSSTRRRLNPRVLGRKAQWGVLMPNEVAKMRIIIIGKIMTIGLRVGLLNNETLSRQAQTAESWNVIFPLVTDVYKRLEVVQKEERSKSEDRHVELMATMARHEGTLIALNENFISFRAQAHSELQIMRQVCLRQLTGVLDFKGSSLTGIKTTNRRLISLNRRQKPLASQVSVDRMLTSIRDLRRSTNAIVTSDKSRFDYCKSFAAEVLKYLQQIVRSNLEIYELLLKLHTIWSNVPGAISYSQADSFEFEDVLGRKMSLHCYSFQYWEVFEAMLRCRFKDMIGESKVLRGDYHILLPDQPGIAIEPHDWQKTIFPGSRIKKLCMSVRLSRLRTSIGKCPRPGCSGKASPGTQSSVAICPLPECNLTFFLEQDSRASSHIEDGNKSVTKTEPELPAVSTLESNERQTRGHESIDLEAHPDEQQLEKTEILQYRRVHLGEATKSKRKRTTKNGSAENAIEQFLDSYEQEQEYWELLARTVSAICKTRLRRLTIQTNVSWRTKNTHSLKNKLLELGNARGRYKTIEEIRGDVSDLAQVRIAFFSPKIGNIFDSIIKENFDVVGIREWTKHDNDNNDSSGQLIFNGRPWRVLRKYYHVRLRREDIETAQLPILEESVVEIQLTSYPFPNHFPQSEDRILDSEDRFASSLDLQVYQLYDEQVMELEEAEEAVKKEGG